MQQKLFVGETIAIETTIADRDGEVFNPDTVIISAINPSGDETVHSTDDLVQSIFTDSVGVYRSYFEADEAGTWIITTIIEYPENGQTVISREERNFRVFRKASETL